MIMLLSFKLFNISSITCIAFRNCSLEKQAHMFKKILDKQDKKLKNSSSSPLVKQIFPDSNDSNKDKKVISLNKIWMEKISQVFASGYASELLDLGVEISKVKVVRNPACINVFWMSKNDKVNEKEVLKLLNNIKTDLKTTPGLSIYGRVPELRFVRDVFMENQVEVLNLLSVIDVGKNEEEFTPPPVDYDVEYDGEELKVPEMRQDLFGLNHEKIKNKILKEIVKCQWDKLPEFDAPNGEDLEEGIDSRKFIPFNQEIFKKYHRRSINLKMSMDKLFDTFTYEGKYVFDKDDDNGDDDDDYCDITFDPEDNLGEDGFPNEKMSMHEFPDEHENDFINDNKLDDDKENDDKKVQV